jgi:hypothetical protein
VPPFCHPKNLTPLGNSGNISRNLKVPASVPISVEVHPCGIRMSNDTTGTSVLMPSRGSSNRGIRAQYETPLLDSTPLKLMDSTNISAF